MRREERVQMRFAAVGRLDYCNGTFARTECMRPIQVMSSITLYRNSSAVTESGRLHGPGALLRDSVERVVQVHFEVRRTNKKEILTSRAEARTVVDAMEHASASRISMQRNHTKLFHAEVSRSVDSSVGWSVGRSVSRSVRVPRTGRSR